MKQVLEYLGKLYEWLKRLEERVNKLESGEIEAAAGDPPPEPPIVPPPPPDEEP